MCTTKFPDHITGTDYCEYPFGSIVSSFMLITWCINLIAFKIMFAGIKVPAFTVPVGKSKDTNEWGWINWANWIDIKQEMLKIKDFSSTLPNFQALLGFLEALSRPLSLFKDFSREAFIFKYFSFLYEPCPSLYWIYLSTINPRPKIKAGHNAAWNSLHSKLRLPMSIHIYTTDTLS